MIKKAARTKTHVRQMARKPRSTKSVRKPLTEQQVNRIITKLGGLRGYCVTWGWLTLARAIERAHKIQ